MPALKPHVDYLRQLYAQVDHRIQTRPLCHGVDRADLLTGPISRKPRATPTQVRSALGIPPNAKLVLVSMGGVPDRFDFLRQIPPALDVFLVVPSADGRQTPHEKVILLPTRSAFFHPDLVQAADLVIGKAGYSTVAEAYQAGVPLGYICRPCFPESDALEKFIANHLPSRPIQVDDYHSGRWLSLLPDLLSLPRSRPAVENGADAVARFICRRFFNA